ncbi:MAG: hypothetical protein JNJ44_04505 [Zoogloeaceae bacterium]|nr:hypothetical protein [Zoogloeaceae bacterium]
MTTLLRLFTLLATALASAWGATAAHGEVLVVVSESGGAYDEAAEAFRAELQRLAPRQTVVVNPVGNLGSMAEYQLIVTLGSQAARSVAAMGQRPPTIHSLVPKATYDRMAGLKDGRDTAVLLDQPATRQIDLIRVALPGFGRIALLEGGESRELVGQLAEAARERKFAVQREVVMRDNDIFTALQRVLSDPAALIATPDTTVFNGYSIQNIMLTAYRQRSPVLGFSASYVRAGAVLGLYSTPAQIGRQTAELARAALGGQPLPPPQNPRYFEISTNPQVARSIGIFLEEPAQIRASIARLEGVAQ